MTDLLPHTPVVIGDGQTKPTTYRWNTGDSILYALAVGAGQTPARELQFTTENSIGAIPRALPTLAVVLAHTDQGLDLVQGLDRDYAVHAQQRLDIHRELPVAGELTATTRVRGLYDKGNATLLVLQTNATTALGEALFTSTMTVFYRGIGGWGGPPVPAPQQRPDRPGSPTLTIDVSTRPDQALLYRLTGDRNPLHSDPTFAQRVGFAQPILHGLCTYGIAGRVLLGQVCEGNPAMVRSVSSRFSSPVVPGETLTVLGWHTDPGSLSFDVLGADGRRVISDGNFEYVAATMDADSREG
jgi:acyl dehydratase